MKKNIVAGIVAAFIAGAINGAIITYLGFWEQISMKFEAASPLMAFTMHMLFSVLTGILFTLLLSKYLSGLTRSIVYGFTFSVFVYIIALMLISLRFGASQFNFTDPNFIFRVLVGHGSFGVLMGFGYFFILKKLRQNR